MKKQQVAGVLLPRPSMPQPPSSQSPPFLAPMEHSSQGRGWFNIIPSQHLHPLGKAKMQIPGLLPRLISSRSLGIGFRNLCF